MTPITPEQLGSWKALAEKATPGPWELNGQGWDVFIISTDDPDTTICKVKVLSDTTSGDTSVTIANADLIAVSRTALPALIAEVERLRDAIDIRDELLKDAPKRETIEALARGTARIERENHTLREALLAYEDYSTHTLTDTASESTERWRRFQDLSAIALGKTKT